VEKSVSNRWEYVRKALQSRWECVEVIDGNILKQCFVGFKSLAIANTLQNRWESDEVL
jgi:hypothetical protein